MQSKSFRRSLSALSGVSLLALAAAMPHVAYADTLTGAPGQGLLAGSVLSNTGTVTDLGVDAGVVVQTGVPGDLILLQDVVISSTDNGTAAGLSIVSYEANANNVQVFFTGPAQIQSGGAALSVYATQNNIIVDTGAGGSTFTSDGGGIQLNAGAGSVELYSHGDTIAAGTGSGISASSNGARDVSVYAMDGSITGGNFGIAAGSHGGAVVVNSSSAISGQSDVGISASGFNGSSVDVTTATGGTIDGGVYGIYASTDSASAVNVTVGDAIGGTLAPTAGGVVATSEGGAVNVVSSANITAGSTGIQASTTGGTGAVAVTIDGGDVHSTTQAAVAAQVWGGSGDVAIIVNGDRTLSGLVGANAYSSGTGAVSVSAADAGSLLTGAYSGIDARAAGGALTIEAGGTVHGGIDGIYARNSGAGTITVDATGPISGMRGVNAQTSGAGAITIGTSGSPLGAVTTTDGDGVYASGGGAISIHTGAVSTAGGGGVSQAASGASQGSFYGSGLAIDATTTNGAVTIVAGGPVTGGAGGGVLGQTAGAGNVSITTGQVTATAGGRGIEGDATSGSVTITAGGPVTAVRDGIFARVTGTGGITISAADGVTSTLGHGIRASSTGTGAVVIGTSGQRVGPVSGGDNGIRAVSGGSISVYAGQVSGVTNGLLTSGGQAGNVNATVVVDANGAITSVNPGRTGVQANNFGQLGNSSSTVNLTGSVTANGRGVDAGTINGDITVTTAAVTGGNNHDDYSQAVHVDGGGDSQILVTTNGVISGGSGVVVLGAGTLARDTVTVVTNQAVTGLSGAGVSVSGGNALVSVDTNGQVTATGGAGVFASGAGAVTVETAGVSVTGGTAPATTVRGGVTGVTDLNGYGVAAISTGGPVSVTSTGAVGGGAAGGIVAQTAGANAVTVTTGAVTTTGGRGIEAYSEGGLITVNAGGAVTGASAGIYTLNSGAGGIDIATTGAVTSGTSTGVRANTLGSGTINIGTSSQRLGGAVTSNGASGVVGQGGGNVNVYAGQVTGAFNAITAVSNQAGANGAVVVDANGTLTANSGYGVLALNTGTLASNTTTVTTTGAINAAGGAGIDAESTGGDVMVTTNGVINAIGGNGTFWDGIYARGAGDSAVSVTANAAVHGSYMGIDVATAGTLARDTVTVVAFDEITSAHGAGIFATGVNGLVDVNAIGEVTAVGGGGVFARGAGAVTVTTNTVTATGGVTPTQNANGQVTDPTFTSGIGVAATSTGGPVSITTNAAVSGANGGVYGYSATDTVTINTAAVSSSAGRGIEGYGAGGLVTLNAGGPVTSYGDAIYAANYGTGGIAVTAPSGAISTTGSGLRVRDYGGGTLTVGAANNRIGALVGGDAGLRAVGNGSISVHAGDVSGVTNGILVSGGQANTIQATVLVDSDGDVTSVNAGRTGVQAYNFGQLGNSSATVTLTGSVTAGGRGVDVQTANGDITVTTAAVTAGTANAGYDQGVFVDGSGDSRISVTTNGAVSGAAGVVVMGHGTLARDSVSVAANGAVTGSNGAGVFASGAQGVSVTTHGVTSTGGTAATVVGANPVSGVSAANGYGVAAISTGGNVAVTALGAVSGGLGGGIVAQSAGTGTVSVTTGAVTTTGGRAIEAAGQGGLVTINAGGLVSSAQGGIYAQNSGVGGITINTAAAVSGGAFNGIRATATGSGAINLGSSGQSLADVSSGAITAVTATGRGDVNVYATSVTGGTNAIAAQSLQPGVGGAVTVNTSGAVVGANGFGIIARNTGLLATSTVTVNTTGTVTATGGTAIDAEASGGDITVTSSGVVTANAGNGQYWDAIFAHGAGDSAVTVTTNAAVNGSYIGIDAASAGTAARDTVTINANDAVSAGYPGVSAIQAVSTGLGSVVVNKAATGNLSANGGYGITAAATASTGTANVTVTNAAQIGSAAEQTITGIAVTVAAGNAGAINVTSSGTLYATDYGISAVNSGAGGVNVTLSGAVQTAGTGVYASTTAGDIAVTTLAGGTIAPGAQFGIEAYSDTGAITINQAGDIGVAGVGGTVGQGIHAEIAGGSGDLNITSTGHIYITPGVGPAASGIYAVNLGTGAVNVVSTGIIDPGAYGAFIQGAGPVSYTANGGVVEGDTGIYIESTGGGPVELTTTGGAAVTGFTGAGAEIVGNGGDLDVTLGGTITGATTGVVASTTGAGSTTLVTTGDIVGGTGPGIDVSAGTGGLVLTVTGDVSSTGSPAINATSAAGGTINIGAGAQITGLVSAANTGVINLNTASGSLTTLNVAAGAQVSASAGSAFNVAVKAVGGSVTVNNNGTLVGQVDFSALTGANAGTLNNAVGTVFLTGGTNLFNVGADNFVNAGQIDTVGALTTFDFLGGVNAVTNNGTIRVGFNPVAASSFRLLAVNTFANTGTLSMGNGVVGDSIVASGAAFTGSGASRLLVDANLGAPGALSDTFTVGSAAGTTRLVVNDTGAAFGSYNPAGIVVVNGTTHDGNFVLDATSDHFNASLYGGVLDKPGMFFYDLAINGAGATVLVSAPKREALQLTNLGASAQTIWYATAPSGESHARRRDALRDGDASADKAGVWVSVTGGRATRDHTQSFTNLNQSYAYDTSYEQDITGLTFGVDGAWRGDQEGQGSWLFGAQAGYVSSRTDFDGTATRAKMEGATFGAWASYLNGDVFVDLDYTGNLLAAKVSAPALAGLSGKPDVTSHGASIGVGIRKPFIGGSSIEPLASLAYVKTSIDNLAAGGETLTFEDATSLRASLGARVSGRLQDGDNWRVGYTVTLRAVDELEGDNGVVFSGMGTPLTLRDDFQSVYGELGAGLKFEGKGGWSGFVEGSWMFNDEYSAPTISLGGKYRF